MTENGYFVLNFVYAPVRLVSEPPNFENNCVETNRDRPILSVAKMISGKSSFWQYKACADIRLVP